MALSKGTRLGSYEILEPLGAGGMGEVYRAHDARLDRDVALKVLPDGALADDEARRRFSREAKALSRLSHPHIATLFDSDEADGTDFLVMELVRGPSLRDELEDKGALPEKDVIRLGTQLARGLQAAHEQGVVHRDLKPANLQLTPDGLLKILDFGLARLAPVTPSPGKEPGPTQTAVGRVAGTLPYMSPEQLRGRGVDARTDLYSAGAVLYEMATGKRLFSKPSSSELTAAILNEDPTPPRDKNARISTGLEAVLLKALDKDPELRYQTAKELLVDLERLQLRAGSTPSGAVPVPPSATSPRGARTGRRPLVAAAVAVAALAIGFWLLRSSPLPRIADVQPLRVDLGPAFSEFIKPTWTTDGQRLYFVAREEGVYRLYQVPLAGGERAEIETPFGRGLELHGFVQSRSALLVRGQLEPIGSRSAGPTIWLVPVPTGTPQPVGPVRGHTAALSPDERTIAVAQWDVGADTTMQRGQVALTGLDGSDPRVILEGPRLPEWLRWSPGGSRLRFVAGGPEGHEGEGWLWETSPQGAGPRPLWPGQRGDWTTDGRYFVFERPHVSETWLGVHSGARNEIYVVPEHPRWPWARAQPIRLTTGPLSFSHVGPRPDGRGLLAFGTTPRGELQRFDRRTGRLEPFLGGESVGMVRPSPDGEWLAWVSFPESQLWRGRRDGTERLRLTRPSQHAFMPSWSPDGARIAFVGDAPGDPRLGLHTVSADGGASETLAVPSGRLGFWDNCWTPGGDSILFSELASEGLGIRRIDVATESVNLLPGAERMAGIKCGPQGQLLALGAVDGDSRLGLFVRGSDADAWEPIPFDFRNVYPTWARDGQAVCGLRIDGNSVGCYSFATARVETVIDLGDTPLLAWVFVPWFGLDADDNPLIMIDRSTRDLYSIDWKVS